MKLKSRIFPLLFSLLVATSHGIFAAAEDTKQVRQEKAHKNIYPGTFFDFDEDRSCAVCQKNENNKACSSCQSCFYCSRDHQKLHWQTHKSRCSELKKQKSFYQAQAKAFAILQTNPLQLDLILEAHKVLTQNSKSYGDLYQNVPGQFRTQGAQWYLNTVYGTILPTYNNVKGVCFDSTSAMIEDLKYESDLPESVFSALGLGQTCAGTLRDVNDFSTVILRTDDGKFLLNNFAIIRANRRRSSAPSTPTDESLDHMKQFLKANVYYFYPHSVDLVIETILSGKDALSFQLPSKMTAEKIQRKFSEILKKTENQLSSFQQESFSQEKEGAVIKILADFSIEMIRIHPFTDGNKRTMRVILNSLAEKHLKKVFLFKDENLFRRAINKDLPTGDSVYFQKVLTRSLVEK